MPTSEKQIEANRRNAQKSTGPRTPEGKSVVSRNAVKNGLNTRTIILKSPHFSTLSGRTFKEDGSRIKVRDDIGNARSA